jgi:hypothetical protein
MKVDGDGLSLFINGQLFDNHKQNFILKWILTHIKQLYALFYKKMNIYTCFINIMQTITESIDVIHHIQLCYGHIYFLCGIVKWRLQIILLRCDWVECIIFTDFLIIACWLMGANVIGVGGSKGCTLCLLWQQCLCTEEAFVSLVSM